MRFDGKALRRLRKERGLTQEKLAHRAGLTLARINRLENHTPDEPKLSTVQKIATALGVEPTELLAFDDEPIATP